MNILTKLSRLPLFLVYHILDFLDFDYYEYVFYQYPKRKRGRMLTIIKHPFYRYLDKTEDEAGYVALQEKKDRAYTI